jgi:hypothetical protein
MKFPINTAVRVTAKKEVTTEKGKSLTFVTFANKQTYEVLETRLALSEGQTETSIMEGSDYTAVVDYDGTWGSVTLTPAVPTTPVTPATLATPATPAKSQGN